MRAGRHLHLGVLLGQAVLQFQNGLCVEHMLDAVGAAVYEAGRYVGVGDQVHLPQTVVADDLAGSG